jgi:hypothetical protein
MGSKIKSAGKLKEGILSVVDQMKNVGKSLKAEFLLHENDEQSPKMPVSCFDSMV